MAVQLNDFRQVAARAEAETQEEIQEFLDSDLGKDPYQELRDHLCDAFEPTLEQKLNQFLGISSMRDRKPSTFIRELDRWHNHRASQEKDFHQ